MACGSLSNEIPWVKEDVSEIVKLSVSRLSLEVLDLETYLPMFEHMNFSALRTLRLSQCRHVLPFLEALTIFYSHAPCNLTQLKIMLHLRPGSGYEVALHALERLLYVIPFLCHLQVDAGGDKLLPVNTLFRHGSSLQYLCMSTECTSAKVYLTSQDLSALFHECPYLQQLAIALCPIDLGPIETMGSEFALDANSTSTSPRTGLQTILVRMSFDSWRPKNC
jgi:hypothetical protein